MFAAKLIGASLAALTAILLSLNPLSRVTLAASRTLARLDPAAAEPRSL